ncbi:THUMP domain-containing class I SAM-dependent RNA methyltransferase [Jiulongibacter sp. NS-SX5]|uniref:THUMP domain-containing class I SAM-dependent RNA methyltransferase n=1 Tax=Jiulongibacter sp. NS-SX5 TaxID=3463854 RepID=UPI00405812B6
MDSYQMSAKTFSGLEKVLAEEIKLIGGKNVTPAKRIVHFEGDDALMMKANLALRTALSVLIPFAEFRARNEDELYHEIKEIPWEDIFSLEHTFSIQAVVGGQNFNHSKYVAFKTKDGIADRFRQVYGRRPNVDPKNADYQLNIHINQDRATLSFNSSGRTLDRRGYRLKSNEAPLNECLAAGIILKSNWDKKVDVYDPMSGSGTFGIEAALIGQNKAPGMKRRFAFQNWTDFNQELFYQVKDELREKERPLMGHVYSADIESQNLSIIRENAERAGVSEGMSIIKEDYFQSKKRGQSGIIFLNPPYGERMHVEKAKETYKSIGDQLKQNYPNCEAWVISSNFPAMKAFGLKAEKKEIVFNGGLECRLQQYKLF